MVNWGCAPLPINACTVMISEEEKIKIIAEKVLQCVSRASAGETIKNYGFSFHAEDLQVSEL
jgi:predicted aldo/keto reductase-like oxidoreductase